VVILKSPAEIEKIRESNAIVAEVLHGLRNIVRPGVTTRELDEYAESLALKRGAKPAFKGYRGFPSSLCASINHEVVHGIPSKTRLKEGDIISLDFGVLYKGYYGDAAVTLPVGNISGAAAKLIKVTRESLYKGIEKASPGNRLGDLSLAVQNHVERAGFSVVRDFVGHGIGRGLHEDPPVLNYGVKGKGIELKSGMVLAIEPMVNMGTHKVKVMSDGWTVVAVDGSLSAHFEHTVAITDDGPVILSKMV
jgi:methionyl aminopeptidase